MLKSIKKYLLLILSIALLLFAIFNFFNLKQQIKEDRQLGINKAEKELNNAVTIFNDRLQLMMIVTQNLARKISNQKLDSIEINIELKSIMEKYPDVFGIGVGYEPYMFSESKELYAPFYIRPNDSLKLTHVEDSYNYTNSEWYLRPLSEGEAWFEPPYFGVVSHRLMAEYSVPFYKKDSLGNQKPIGIVYLDFSIEVLAKAVKNLDLGKTGYGVVFSKNGLLLSHPIADYMYQEKTLDDISKLWGDPKFKKSFENLDTKSVELENKENGKKYRLFTQEVEATGWKMGGVFVQDAFKTNYQFLSKANIIITASIVFSILFFLLYLLVNKSFGFKKVYVFVTFYSFIVTLSLVYIWYFKLENHTNIFNTQESYPITERSTLEKFLHDRDSLREHNYESKLIKIPTGVFLKHIEFDGSHNIQMSGIIWQKYPIDNKGREIIKPGLLFLETAPDAEAMDFDELYRKVQANHLLVGWHFRLEVREKLDYVHYPFDKETISLRIEYPDLTKGVLLVPDLNGYTSINPTLLPGLDPGLVLPDWDSEGSYYDFRYVNYNTDFGVVNNFTKLLKPELNYNVVLKRKFFWAFLSNFIPLLAILILLYLSLLTFTVDQGKLSFFGFSGFGMLELATAFLFVAILTHIDLRSNVNVNYIIYLDYFYFHVYIMILFCSINSTLFIRKIKLYSDNFLPKVLFWPALLTSLFVFTCFSFY